MYTTEARSFIHQGITHTTTINRDSDLDLLACHGCKAHLAPDEIHVFARHKENEIRYFFVHSECAIRTTEECGDDLIQSHT